MMMSKLRSTQHLELIVFEKFEMTCWSLSKIYDQIAQGKSREILLNLSVDFSRIRIENINENLKLIMFFARYYARFLKPM